MTTVFDDKFKEQHSFLHAFCVRPHVHFEEQQDDEDIILSLRAHPVTQLPWVFITGILLSIPLLTTFILVSLLSITQLLFVNLFWYSFVFSYVFINILNWAFNVGVVTDKRIVDIDFNLVISKEITAAPLEDTTDITVKSNGFLPSLFNYGNVFIQTPGATQNIEFHNISRPTEVVKIINELMAPMKHDGKRS